MMKWVFSALILLSVVFGIMNGQMSEVTNAALQECSTAVTLFLSLVGVMALWSGLMNVAVKSGATNFITRLFTPIARFLFKGLDPNSKAFHAISMNMTANLLGLGNAATPLGLEAMSELEKENKGRKTASNHMVMLVVINTASIQLIPTTIAALRLKHGSASPFEIIPAILLSSIFSVISAVLIVIAFRRIGDKNADKDNLVKDERRNNEIN